MPDGHGLESGQRTAGCEQGIPVAIQERDHGPEPVDHVVGIVRDVGRFTADVQFDAAAGILVLEALFGHIVAIDRREAPVGHRLGLAGRQTTDLDQLPDDALPARQQADTKHRGVKGKLRLALGAERFLGRFQEAQVRLQKGFEVDGNRRAVAHQDVLQMQVAAADPMHHREQPTDVAVENRGRILGQFLLAFNKTHPTVAVARPGRSRPEPDRGVTPGAPFGETVPCRLDPDGAWLIDETATVREGQDHDPAAMVMRIGNTGLDGFHRPGMPQFRENPGEAIPVRGKPVEEFPALPRSIVRRPRPAAGSSPAGPRSG